MTIPRIIGEENTAAVRSLLESGKRVAITCHMTPDGDALGSSLGLAEVLNNCGHHAVVITPDTPPKNLLFLPGAGNVVIASRHPERARALLAGADLVFCLDYNALKRIDRLQPLLEESTAPRIMVDHHLDPDDFCDVTISHPEVSSTSALVYRLLDELGWSDRVNTAAATCIYTGMLTDTGNFSYNSNDPALYMIIARLLEAGLDKDAVYTRVWNTNSANRLRICGYAKYRKMQLMPDHGLSLITLTREELNEFDYVKGDTEGLVNEPLSIPGIVWSVYMRQDEPDYVKVSMRSKGDFPVNTVCESLYNGGGHLNAAGGEFDGSLDDCVRKFLDSVGDYDRYLPETTFHTAPQS